MKHSAALTRRESELQNPAAKHMSQHVQLFIPLNHVNSGCSRPGMQQKSLDVKFTSKNFFVAGGQGDKYVFVVPTCHPESLDKRDYFPSEITVDRTASQIVPQQTNNKTHKAAASTWREIYG